MRKICLVLVILCLISLNLAKHNGALKRHEKSVSQIQLKDDQKTEEKPAEKTEEKPAEKAEDKASDSSSADEKKEEAHKDEQKKEDEQPKKYFVITQTDAQFAVEYLQLINQLVQQGKEVNNWIELHQQKEGEEEGKFTIRLVKTTKGHQDQLDTLQDFEEKQQNSVVKVQTLIETLNGLEEEPEKVEEKPQTEEKKGIEEQPKTEEKKGEEQKPEEKKPEEKKPEEKKADEEKKLIQLKAKTQTKNKNKQDQANAASDDKKADTEKKEGEAEKKEDEKKEGEETKKEEEAPKEPVKTRISNRSIESLKLLRDANLQFITTHQLLFANREVDETGLIILYKDQEEDTAKEMLKSYNDVLGQLEEIAKQTQQHMDEDGLFFDAAAIFSWLIIIIIILCIVIPIIIIVSCCFCCIGCFYTIFFCCDPDRNKKNQDQQQQQQQPYSQVPQNDQAKNDTKNDTKLQQ